MRESPFRFPFLIKLLAILCLISGLPLGCSSSQTGQESPAVSEPVPFTPHVSYPLPVPLSKGDVTPNSEEQGEAGNTDLLYKKNIMTAPALNFILDFLKNEEMVTIILY